MHHQLCGRALGLLLLACAAAVEASAYKGFDCAQGSAVLVLARHQCASEVQQHVLGCFNSLALRVKRCGIKAWPHPHGHGRKQACWGTTVVANVTDVNTAQGTLHLHGSHQVLPVQLEFRRGDESMHVSISSSGSDGREGSKRAPATCTLVFDVRSASEGSLHPVPGEDGRVLSSVLAVVCLAMVVPCVCVGLIMALASLSQQAPFTLLQQALVSMGRGGDSSDGRGSRDGSYQPLPTGADAPDRAPPAPPAAAVATHAKRTCSASGSLGLLRVSGRRARAKRLRRSCRPAYVGLPEQSLAHHREYIAGTLQPGPFHLVAPFFKFPPIAVPPALEAIPEASSTSSPTCSSRASSAAELPLGVAASLGEADAWRNSPPLLDGCDDSLQQLLLAPVEAPTAPGVQQQPQQQPQPQPQPQQPQQPPQEQPKEFPPRDACTFDGIYLPNLFPWWTLPPGAGDAEEGGTAARS